MEGGGARQACGGATLKAELQPFLSPRIQAVPSGGPLAAKAATLTGLRRTCAAMRGPPAHEGTPTDPAGQRRRLGEQSLRGLCSPSAPAPHPRMRRRRVAAAAMPRRGTRLSAGLKRVSRAARPLRRRVGMGAFEALRSQHRLRGRCRDPPRRAAAFGAGRGECAGLLAAEAERGVQTMDPWRVGHQSDRNMAVCARVCRFGAANGPFHVLLYVLCAL